jgi:hypothetical protein
MRVRTAAHAVHAGSKEPVQYIVLLRPRLSTGSPIMWATAGADVAAGCCQARWKLTFSAFVVVA